MDRALLGLIVFLSLWLPGAVWSQPHRQQPIPPSEGQPEARLEGLLLFDGEPLPRTMVRLTSSDPTRGAYVVNSDEQGIFRIGSIQSGHYTLSSVLRPGIHYSCSFEAIEGNSVLHDIEYSGGTAMMIGRVDARPFSRVNRAPILLESLDCEEEGPSFTFRSFSKEDGEFEFGALPPGRYLLSTTFRRKAQDLREDPRPDGEERPAVARVELEIDGSQTVELGPKLGRSSLRITPRQRRLSPWKLYLLEQDAPVVTLKSHSRLLNSRAIAHVITHAFDEGSATRVVDRLPAGNYRLVMLRGDGRKLEDLDMDLPLPFVEIELRAGQTTEVEIDPTVRELQVRPRRPGIETSPEAETLERKRGDR